MTRVPPGSDYNWARFAMKLQGFGNIMIRCRSYCADNTELLYFDIAVSKRSYLWSSDCIVASTPCRCHRVVTLVAVPSFPFGYLEQIFGLHETILFININLFILFVTSPSFNRFP